MGVDLGRHGMHMAFAMRQQCISAIYAKVLRLNSASITDVSAGRVRTVPNLTGSPPPLFPFHS